MAAIHAAAFRFDPPPGRTLAGRPAFSGRSSLCAMTTATAARVPFVRDRFTWLAYFMLGYFAYLQAAVGPIMPFLRDELALSYTLAGLHITVMAIGMILAGLSAAAAAARWGRGLLFWGGGAGMLAGAILLAAGRTPAVTLAGMFVMGLVGTYLLIMVQATLSDQHGPRRATALTESNTVAAGATTLPPLLVGLFSQGGPGWRAALFAAGLAWIAVTALTYRTPLPQPTQPQTATGGARRALPRAFWLTWIIVVLVVSVEWSVVAWSATFLNSEVGLEPGLASGLMTAYFLAMVIGRFTGSRLTTRLESHTLLPAALALAGTGFLIFWLSPTPVLNVIGLFLAGLGIANLFPMSLVIATTAGANQPDRASSLVTLACGIAITIAPQVLGTAADAIGLQTAMGLIVILLAAAAGMVAVVRRLSRTTG